MSTGSTDAKRVTTHTLQEMKSGGVPIAMLTAYDYSLARLVDAAGIDVILVGDSASNVMAGHETTLPITLDQMIYHAGAVVRGCQRALIVVDLPFGTYQGNTKGALNSAIRIMKESGAHAVKLEGGREVIGSVERILTAGIPVMGHLGLTPQSIYKFGTYVVRAREEAEAQRLREDAVLLGCREPGVQRQGLGEPQVQRVDGLGGVADLPLSRTEHQDVAHRQGSQFGDGRADGLQRCTDAGSTPSMRQIH